MHDWKRLIEIFLQKNTELNLSAIRDKEWVQLKHIQDSLKLLETWLFQPWKLVIDLWTGSGFPLMPLAISCPESQFLGIDSVKKKTDIITARAVAYSDKLLKRSYSLIKNWGYFLFMKQKEDEERKILLELCKKYHLSLEKEVEYSLFEGDIQRVIYVLRKI